MIETHGLVKRYGPRAALDGVDLAVPAGVVYGLVGPNGAGKTTLFGILSGLRRATAGTVAIDAPAHQMAVLPDTPRFDPWLTGREVVSLARHLVDGDPARVDEVLAQAGLVDAADRRVGGYSRGMLQRLGVACTVVGDPELVLLDEPASALDPEGRREVLDLIGMLRGTSTVLFSSHILSDVQEVCDMVGILANGQLLYQGSLESLLVGAAIPRYVVRFRAEAESAVPALQNLDWVTGVDTVDATTLALSITSLEAAETQLPAALASLRLPVIAVHPEGVDLERTFLELTK
jgi:ABC-2 type transport system ATP-binding protein